MQGRRAADDGRHVACARTVPVAPWHMQGPSPPARPRLPWSAEQWAVEPAQGGGEGDAGEGHPERELAQPARGAGAGEREEGRAPTPLVVGREGRALAAVLVGAADRG